MLIKSLKLDVDLLLEPSKTFFLYWLHYSATQVAAGATCHESQSDVGVYVLQIDNTVKGRKLRTHIIYLLVQWQK